MFYTGQKKLKLIARNEGKLKAYESCFDVRAWSHDIEARDRYIRDWIKSDMPICVLPVRIVTRCLRNMTWRRHEKSTPRCHPNCKSKVVLESICNSCHAMRECLKNDENFEKYFDEEEFETSHWPCEKCLEALKSIKMFWKIITQRIFRISFPKNDDLEGACCSNESVQSVAKVWEQELVQQALVVQNLTPLLNTQVNERQPYCWQSYTNYLKKIMTFDNLRFIVEDDDESNVMNKKLKENLKVCSCEDKATETDSKRSNHTANKRRSKLTKKLNKCTSFRAKTVNFGNDACNIDAEEINMYKNNLDYLQQQYNMQNDELNQLKAENMSLKLQLQSMTRKSASSYFTMVKSDNSASVMPIPYESYCEDEESVKVIDSEMIISLKACENENFKHVSLLQVLHRTNGSRVKDENFVDKNNYCKEKQDPIKILETVHKTFGAIVKRELTIANQRKRDPKVVDIYASYQKVHASRSVPSCSTVSSRSSLSDIFVSTTDVKEI
ncbi:uncharacterized protein LOC123876523 [Maniola jurtina]|uniref:uncharacterized protein LOC123876523 n=1 Tax=Maniola jurtina TaxID=191418 RepID=UPI001E689898|nr:uncharacterized protein LOC123876523 [Maniola jurtina]